MKSVKMIIGGSITRTNAAVPVNANCKNCTYFLDKKNTGVCRLFRYNYIPHDELAEIYVDIDLARNKPELCGPSALYFKDKVNLN